MKYYVLDANMGPVPVSVNIWVSFLRYGNRIVAVSDIDDDAKVTSMFNGTDSMMYASYVTHVDGELLGVIGYLTEDEAKTGHQEICTALRALDDRSGNAMFAVLCEINPENRRRAS
jgi:hypothetical protein